MKKIIILVIMSFTSYAATAQEYYKPGTQVSADDITFNVLQEGYSFSLRNIKNSKLDTTPKYLDGTEIRRGFIDGQLKALSSPFDSIIVNTFTREEYATLQTATHKQRVTIITAISNTGEILEVEFMIAPTNKALLQLPPAKYALLEKNIKKFTKFKIEGDYTKMEFLPSFNVLTFTKPYPIKHYTSNPVNTEGIITRPGGTVIK